MNNLHIGALHLFCSISMFLLKAQTGVLATGLQVLTKAHRSRRSFFEELVDRSRRLEGRKTKTTTTADHSCFSIVQYCIVFFGKRFIAGPITGYSLENGQ